MAERNGYAKAALRSGFLRLETQLPKILAGSRDHARTPVQWTSDPYAGFSDATPWILGAGDENTGWNAQDEAEDPNSVLNFYKSVIALRRQFRALVYGSVKFIGLKRKDYFGYFRTLGEQQLLVECNLSNQTLRREPVSGNFKLVASNYDRITLDGRLRPYEVSIYTC